MQFPEKIQAIDARLFQFINRDLGNAWFDKVVPWFRYQQTWYPLYLFLLVFAFMNFGKKAWWWMAGFVVTVSASDSINSRIIKSLFERPRPCNDADMLPYLTLRVTHCSGGYSFTSSHAANHFAMAMFVFSTLAPLYGRKNLWWLFVWAACVAFAQVYVGVHYPFDVAGGALVGMSIGAITGYFFNRKLPLASLS